MPDARGTLTRFAADVEALRSGREAGEAVRVGAILPTYNRPDLVRACVLQLAAQSRPPDIICIHQNGRPESYHWAVQDLEVSPQLAWLHTAQVIPQHHWYAVPLRFLLDAGCTHFFWTDHDDIYLRNHVEAGLAELGDYDFSVSPNCGLLYTKPGDYRYEPEMNFTAHAPGGMSSTMCFNRKFAAQLLTDLEADQSHHYTDNVVAHVTMPKFRCLVSDRKTAIYHSHEGSLTSRHWLEDAFQPGDA